MLKEIIANVPIAKQFTLQELQETLTRDFIALIREKTSFDLTKNLTSYTSIEMEQIISVAKTAYQKILASVVVAPDAKIFIANLFLCKLFELWKNSITPELFFLKIRKAFSPAQIVAALEIFMSVQENQIWVLNFFYDHQEIFPKKNKKIRTIAIYWSRMYSGGIERFLSGIIPIYIQSGYRIILFTDEYKPELEYPLPKTSDFFSRVMFPAHKNKLEIFNELDEYLKKYKIDLLINHHVWNFPDLQILFFRLSEVKILMNFHHELNHYLFGLNRTFIYRLADGLISLSIKRKEFWKNYGVRSYYIPLPVYVDGAENFHGRNPKKCSNTVVYVGRIARADDKNTFEILPIFREVVKVIPNVKLKIVGEVFHEYIFQQMKKFIAENHLESNVEFCGYHKDVGKFYEEADLILSTSPSEGFPMFVVESKFYELPLVLYELPDVELLRDGKGYIAVPQGDFRAAARAIVKILTDTEFRCKLSAEARESLQPFIDYDIAGAWKKIFEDLENNVPVPPHSVENEKIQTLLVKEIWQEKMKVHSLTAQLNFLSAQIQKLQAKN